MLEARSQLRHRSSLFADTSQLLLIVSDGRCLGDRRKVKAAVRRAQDAQIFLVFIVLDNPNKEVGVSLSVSSYTTMNYQYLFTVIFGSQALMSA